jgi:uncharacterized protein YjbI with pentapeptide repeats
MAMMPGPHHSRRQRRERHGGPHRGLGGLGALRGTHRQSVFMRADPGSLRVSASDIASMLSAEARHGEAVDLRNTRVTEPLVLDGRDIAGVDFSGAVFEAPVSFRNAHFRGLSWFKACVFSATADFSGVRFCNDARFDQARFEDTFQMAGSEALGAIEFSGCRFSAGADFSRAMFCGSLSLAGARFRAGVALRQTECLGGFWVDNTVFEGRIDASSMDVHGRAWLMNVSDGETSGASGRLIRMMTCYGYEFLG